MTRQASASSSYGRFPFSDKSAYTEDSMPDTDPPPTLPTPPSIVSPETRQYVDNVLAAALANIKEHFDDGVQVLLDELRENRRLLEAERDARRRGLRILKDDLGRHKAELENKLQRVAKGLPPDEPLNGSNRS